MSTSKGPHTTSLPSTFPRSLRQHRNIYLVVGSSFLFPVDISRCLVLPTMCHNCYHLAIVFKFISALEKADNPLATKSPDVITARSCSACDRIRFIGYESVRHVKIICWPNIANWGSPQMNIFPLFPPP
jgi:hypothetical protein